MQTMQLKHWLIVFALMTTIIFTVMFIQSGAFVRLGYRYANSLGYAAVFIFAALIIQGFWKPWLGISFRATRYASKQKAGGAKAFAKLEVHNWLETHLLLSIFLTVFAGVHSIILFPTLELGFIGYLIGAAAFLFILALGVSGIILENRRGRKSFKTLNRIHLWLTIVALFIAVIHVAASRPGFGLVG
jgi:hypothetical protein